MTYSIPPLDFSRSPNSFYTISEAAPPCDNSTVQTGSSDLELLSRTTTATSVMTGDQKDEDQEPMRKHKRANQGEVDAWSMICDLNARTARKDERAVFEHKVVDLRRMDSASTVGSPRGKLVKRQKSVYQPAHAEKDEKKAWQTFRCDVHPAANWSYSKAEAECKQTVIAAGGEIDTSCVYLGGFFYRLPGWVEDPLRSGDTPLEFGHVEIGAWAPFPKPVFDRFKLKPYHAADRTVTAERRRTIAGPEHLLQDMLLRPKARPKAGRKMVTSWLGMLTKDYGKSVSYLA